MKVLGGGRPRGNMDPIDAYRLERDREREREQMRDLSGQNSEPVRTWDRKIREYEIKQPMKGGFWSGLFGILALISFAGTFVLGFCMELLPAGYEWLLPAMFGSVFFFMGLVIFIGSKSPLALLFVCLGAGISGCSIVYGVCDESIRMALMERLIPASLLSLFVITGFCMIIVPILQYTRKRNTHTQEIRAVVINKTERRWRDSDGHRHRSFVLTWKYYAGGQERVYKSSVGRYPEPRDISYEDVLYLNPDDPDDVWEKSNAHIVILSIMGVIFLAVGLVSLVMFFGIFS